MVSSEKLVLVEGNCSSLGLVYGVEKDVGILGALLIAVLFLDDLGFLRELRVHNGGNGSKPNFIHFPVGSEKLSKLFGGSF